MLPSIITIKCCCLSWCQIILLKSKAPSSKNLRKIIYSRWKKNYFFGKKFLKFCKVTCADVRERFHLFWLLYIVLIRNLSQRDWSVEAVEDILPYMGIILFAEFIIDWFKHAFIVKFNNLSVYIYEEYREILACEFIKARNPANCVEHADLIR